MHLLKTFLETFNHQFTLLILFPLIIGTGFYFTLKLRFIQISKLKLGFLCLIRPEKKGPGSISRFEAIASVLAGNFGTGNISGIAVAIASGGPGALVWMWIMAFFGAVIQYASSVLGILYRKRENGGYSGGPMYYLRDGLGLSKTAALFAICTVFGAIAVGNFAQINSVVLPLQKEGFNPLYCSLLIAGFTGVVILGGISRIGRLAAILVPFKALLYLGAACLIIALHYDRVPDAFLLMLRQAFDFSSLLGGAAGFGVLKAMTTGFDRGLFATDAGTGIVPILQADTRSEHPAMDGLATLVAPLIVMCVCTATGLVLILTGTWQDAHLQSTNQVAAAFSIGLGSRLGGYIVIFALVLFAYTTILAWSYCGEKAIEFLMGPGKIRWFRLAYIALIPVGSLARVELVWSLADLAIALMVAINMAGIIGLAGKVLSISSDFFQQGESQTIESEKMV